MDALLIIVALLFSIVVHEVAHAWQARREGDDTAEQLGRITLNPLPHLDLFGSILVPAMLYLSNAGFLFGWAKPVPVDPSRYRDYVAGDIRVSLAGIVSNLALAVISTVLLAVLLVLRTTLAVPSVLLEPTLVLLDYMILINLVLAFFNLIPIPPLDGSHVLAHLLPARAALAYRKFARYGILALMGIMILVPQAFSVIFWPVVFVRGLVDQFLRLWI